MKNTFVTLILCLLALPHFAFSQNDVAKGLQYEININHPFLSLKKQQLKDLRSLMDINHRFKPEWVREYISVEVLTIHKGKERKAIGKNETLTQEQREHIIMADEGTGISVNVRYLPENTLKNNEPKEESFSFAIEPEKAAFFPGGQQQLQQYLNDQLTGKIPEGVFGQYQLAAVTFTIDEEGRVTDAQPFWPSDDEKTNELLLATVCNMPNWTPAQYANGAKVKQEFALTVGDMESCVVNLLNIRRE